MRRWSLILALAASSAGCSRKLKDEAPCGTVAARLFTIAIDDLEKAAVEPAMRRMVADQLPAMRDALVQICSDGAWSAAVRNCMASAVDHAAFQVCQQQLSESQRRTLDEAAHGKTSSR
jgi:hypothetical protein